MVFFVRITVNQSHLRPICKSTKFNPKIQRTIYSINFQRLRLHVLDFIRTVVIYFGKKEVEGNPKKVCLVVSYYVDYGGLESIIMCSSRKEITQYCKEMAEVEEYCEDPDDPKMVNAKAKEMKKDLLEGYCYSNPINDDPVKVCLTDFVTIKMK